jgi:hypothetical protein
LAFSVPFFKPHKEPLFTEGQVHAEDQAALDAEKLYLCKSGELQHILDTWHIPEEREDQIRKLMAPRFKERFKTGLFEFDLHLQEGVISFIFRHDERLGGGPDNNAGYARATITLALFREEFAPQPKPSDWAPELVLQKPDAKPAEPQKAVARQGAKPKPIPPGMKR